MKVNTARFGRLSIDNDRLIHFPLGIEGGKHLKKFFLTGYENKILWLQAVDDPAVAFIATDPFIFFRDYSIPLKDEMENLLEIKDIKDICVLVFLSFCSETNTVNANLKEPVVINSSNKKAARLRIQTDHYGPSVPLPLDYSQGARTACDFRDIIIKVVQSPLSFKHLPV